MRQKPSTAPERWWGCDSGSEVSKGEGESTYSDEPRAENGLSLKEIQPTDVLKHESTCSLS